MLGEKSWDLGKLFAHCACHQAEFGNSANWQVNGKSCDALALCTEPWNLSNASRRAEKQEINFFLTFPFERKIFTLHKETLLSRNHYPDVSYA